MANLEAARAAIEAEIAHAKRGVAHFSSRIEALEKTLLHLAEVNGIGDGSRGRAKAGKAAAQKTAKSSKSKALGAAKAVKSKRDGNGLPFTGGSFWTDLMSSQPQSASEILNAAIVKLGFTPNKEQLQKLTQRLTFALHALVKSKKIKDSGKGRERRFFKS